MLGDVLDPDLHGEEAVSVREVVEIDLEVWRSRVRRISTLVAVMIEILSSAVGIPMNEVGAIANYEI